MNIKKFTKYFSKKYILYWVIGAVVVFVGWNFIFGKKEVVEETLTVHPGDFLQQVSVSGKVAAAQNLDLSFEQAGITRGVYVKTGDQVSAGKLLASQDTSQLSAQLAEMQAGINIQKAKLAQLLAGQSPQDLQIAEDKVASATQDVANAYQSGVVTANAAYNSVYNAYTTAAYVKVTYFSGSSPDELTVQMAKDRISGYLDTAKANTDKASAGSQADIDAALASMLTVLKNTYNDLKFIREQTDKDMYYSRVSATDKTSLDTQKTNITTAAANVASAQTSVSTYKSALVQAKNNLELAKAPARQTDIDIYQAQIAQAEASAQGVVAQIRKRQVIAPIAGTITAVDAKTGGILGAGVKAVSIISQGSFQIESYVPEIYVSFISLGDEADATLDAYGSDKVFKARVASIDPAETVKDGVSTYKTILQLDATTETVRDGMTANVVITTEKKSNVISVPQGAITSKNGKKFIKVKQGEETVEREVVMGDVSSVGQAEIVSGLNDGDTVVIH